jgi:membrane associated rhomboid family serine protease
MINPNFIAAGTIAILCCITFFLVPNSLALFSFSGKFLFQGEVWRLLTFPFAHVNLNHLIENIVALGITSLLAFELGLRGTNFIYCFLLSSFIVALSDAFLFPSYVIAGASLGIYAVLGQISIQGSNFIPKFVLIPLLGLSAFIKNLFSGFMPDLLQQSLFHFSGFIIGIGLFYAFRIKAKKRILEVV